MRGLSVTVRGLVAAAAAIGLLIAGCGGDDDSESQTLTFTSDSGEAVSTDLGEKGPGAGDIRSFTQDLFEDGGSEPVGRLDGTVVSTFIDESSGTTIESRTGGIQFTLDDGNIVAFGNYLAEPGEAVPADGGVERAIVGGTGAYEGASGTVTQTAEGTDGIRYELDFETEGD